MPSYRRRFVLAILGMSLALPQSARSTTLAQFEKLSDDQQQAFVMDMSKVAEKVLHEAGHPDTALWISDLFSRKPDDPDSAFDSEGMDGFMEDKAAADGARIVREAKKQKMPPADPLEVEKLMVAYMKEQKITLPAAFLEIARAGKIESTAATVTEDYEMRMGIDSTKKIFRDMTRAIQSPNAPQQDAQSAAGEESSAPQSPPSADQQEQNWLAQWKSKPQSPAAFTQAWFGAEHVVRGTVERINVQQNKYPNWVTVYFKESGAFVVCSPYPDIFQAWAQDVNDLVGRTLEAGGQVEGAQCTGGKGASIRIVMSRQLFVR